MRIFPTLMLVFALSGGTAFAVEPGGSDGPRSAGMEYETEVPLPAAEGHQGPGVVESGVQLVGSGVGLLVHSFSLARGVLRVAVSKGFRRLVLGVALATVAVEFGASGDYRPSAVAKRTYDAFRGRKPKAKQNTAPARPKSQKPTRSNLRGKQLLQSFNKQSSRTASRRAASYKAKAPAKRGRPVRKTARSRR